MSKWITASLDSVQFMQLLPVCCSCKRLFDALQPFICLHVYFIDCKCKIDSRHVYGLHNGIKLLYCVSVDCLIINVLTLYFDF